MSKGFQFRFQKLDVWHSARRLSRDVYRTTKTFPEDEAFGITSQIRRAAVSISSNIAEGSGRNSDADFAHFLEIAYGSAMETASLVYLANDIELMTNTTGGKLLDEIEAVSLQISALHRTLAVKKSKTPFDLLPRRRSAGQASTPSIRVGTPN